MEEDKIAEIAFQAHSFFVKMIGVIAERDVDKMATCFYDLVKRTYGMAKEQDVYEKDKEHIDSTLKGMMVLVEAMLAQADWTREMIEDFDEKVMELWIID
jgi:hypothetical protein